MRGERQRRADGHHLGVHGERAVGRWPATTQLVGLWYVLRLLLFLLLLLLCVRVQVSRGHAAILQGPAVETWTGLVVAFANDLATPDDDAAVAVVQRGLESLLEAERLVSVVLWRHC